MDAIQQDYLTGNFQAESHLLNHLKLQTDNIDNEMEIKRQIQTMLEKEKQESINPQDVARTISLTNPQIGHFANAQFDQEQAFDSPERMKSFFENTRNREGTASGLSLKQEGEGPDPQLKVIEDDYSDRM